MSENLNPTCPMSPDPFSLLNSHLPVSRETFDRLKTYHDLLLTWQAKINLVSRDTIDKSWHRHFLDSLQIAKYISGVDGPILDIGTGAGFPGMVLAIYGIKNIILIESDAKKVSFLTEVARLTKTEVKIIHERAEKFHVKHSAIIMARAVSELCHLFETVFHNVSHETTCLFPKGKNYAMEIEVAKKEWHFNCDILPSVTDENAVLLRVSNLQRRKTHHGKESE
jgi:16S rRNA (guanine527-N7)-methyltransferase